MAISTGLLNYLYLACLVVNLIGKQSEGTENPKTINDNPSQLFDSWCETNCDLFGNVNQYELQFVNLLEDDLQTLQSLDKHAKELTDLSHVMCGIWRTDVDEKETKSELLYKSSLLEAFDFILRKVTLSDASKGYLAVMAETEDKKHPIVGFVPNMVPGLRNRGDKSSMKAINEKPKDNGSIKSGADGEEVHEELPSDTFVSPAEKNHLSIKAEAFQEIVNGRRTNRKFDPSKSIPKEVLKEMIESTQRAPSSFNIQPYKVILVTDPAVRQRIAESFIGEGNQYRVMNASVTALFLADTQPWLLVPKAIELSKKQGLPEDFIQQLPFNIAFLTGPGAQEKNFISGHLSPLQPLPVVTSAELWSTKNAMLAAMSFVLSAESHGLSTAVMEGFDARNLMYALDIPWYRYSIPLAVSVGYSIDSDKAKERKSLRFDSNDVFAWEGYNNKADTSMVYMLKDLLKTSIFGAQEKNDKKQNSQTQNESINPNLQPIKRDKYGMENVGPKEETSSED